MELEEIILLQKSPLHNLGDTKFEFDPDDERDTAAMEPLRLSCQLSTIWVHHLYAYSMLDEFLSEDCPSRGSYVGSCIAQWLGWYFSPYSKRYSSALFIAIPIAYGLSMLLSPDIPRLVAGNGFLSFLALCLIGILILVAIAYVATDAHVQAVYTPLYHERVERKDEYMNTIMDLEKSIELTTAHLRELESQGGLTEEYWLYGEQAWEYLRTGRADNLRELRPLLRRHIIGNELKSELDVLSQQIEASRNA